MTSVLMLRARSVFGFGCGAVVLLLVSAAAGVAGEPIIVGKEKPKTDAIKDSKFNKELSRPWEKISPETPMGGLMFPIIPRVESVDPKTDRKRKLQEREKRNWMSVQPGELQEEEESKTFFGVRDYDIQKEEDSDNLMFRELRSERDSQANGRSQNRANEKDTPKPPQRVDTEELERELAARREARAEAARNEAKYGAHTASELNFKGMFGPPPGEARQSDLSLRDMLGASDYAARNQQALREEFKAFLNGKANTPGGGLSDPVNSYRNDFTRQPLNPAIGRAPEQPAGNDVFGAPAGFGSPRPSSPFGTPVGLGDNSISRGLPAWSLPTPPVTAPPTTRPFQPPPNRGVGMNSLGGHSR